MRKLALATVLCAAGLSVPALALANEGESVVGDITPGIGFALTTKEEGETAPTVAASINYNVTEKAAIGLLAEYAFEELDHTIVGIRFRADVGNNFIVTVLPGVEFHESNEEILFRVGIGYDIEIGNQTLVPEFNVDFVDGETSFVYGFAIFF